MSYTKRRLPHWDPQDAALFLTWRLYGSYPRPVEVLALKGGARFVAEDRLLERFDAGPRWLSDPKIASCFVRALRYGAEHLHLYEPRAWVVMSNHVHLLIDPRAPLPRITQSIKGYSGRQANALLGRTGEPFWLDESYDHWVRNADEGERIARYIEANPVSAGLVNVPEVWHWSSASAAGQEACPTLAYACRE
jgi:REP element-mobilizing transposase RayT